MLETKLRPYYQSLLVDNMAAFISHKISPKAITYLAGLFGLLMIPAVLFGYVGLAIIFLIISGYCDTLDGTMARISATTSDTGTVLDILMDRVVEACAIFSLWLISPSTRSLYCILILISFFICITSFLSVAIFTKNESEKGFHYSPGLIERTETFIFFIAMFLLPGLFSYISVLFTTLVILTAFIRVYQFFLNKKPKTKVRNV